MLAVALAATGCTYRWQPAPECLARSLPSALQALPEIRALADPPAAALEAGFVLCSTHRDRLEAAIEALGAEGYSSYLGAAELGKCLRIPRTHEATAAALEREVTAICRVAAGSRVAYVHWQAEVGGRSVFLAGDHFAIDGKRRRMAKAKGQRER